MSNARRLSKGKEILLLLVMVIISIVVLGVMAYSIMSKRESTVGIGADGFSVFVKPGDDLGVTKVIGKSQAVTALGKNAKTVKDVQKSDVVSINGRLGQTATYPFTLPNGKTATIDIDVLSYKDKQSYDSDDVFGGTGTAGKVNGHDVRYLPAISLGGDRVYALLVSDKLKSYKFSISQPNASAYIKEFKAQDILKDIISKATL